MLNIDSKLSKPFDGDEFRLPAYQGVERKINNRKQKAYFRNDRKTSTIHALKVHDFPFGMSQSFC